MLQGQHPISAAEQFSSLRKIPRPARHITPLPHAEVTVQRAQSQTDARANAEPSLLELC